MQGEIHQNYFVLFFKSIYSMCWDFKDFPPIFLFETLHTHYRVCSCYLQFEHHHWLLRIVCVNKVIFPIILDILEFRSSHSSMPRYKSSPRYTFKWQGDAGQLKENTLLRIRTQRLKERTKTLGIRTQMLNLNPHKFREV
ncbi:hypothetical protein U1Q18_028984 [Sarracenia purpurea var. burkii]